MVVHAVCWRLHSVSNRIAIHVKEREKELNSLNNCIEILKQQTTNDTKPVSWLYLFLGLYAELD